MKSIGRSAILLVALLIATESHAATYYKWVDAAGVTHYSESQPASAQAQEMSLPDEYVQPVSAAEDYYSIQNQLERLQQQRRDLLERRLLKEQAAQAARPQPVVQQIIEPAQPVYFPVHRFPRHGFHPGKTDCKGQFGCGKSGYYPNKGQQYQTSTPVSGKAFRNAAKN